MAKKRKKIGVRRIIDKDNKTLATLISFPTINDFRKYYSQRSSIGKNVRKKLDPELIKYFDNNREKYIFEIVVPGTRTEVDFRVQINVYEKINQKHGLLLIRELGYVKVDSRYLKSLEVPEFFLKAGKTLKDYLEFKGKSLEKIG